MKHTPKSATVEEALEFLDQPGAEAGLPSSQEEDMAVYDPVQEQMKEELSQQAGKKNEPEPQPQQSQQTETVPEAGPEETQASQETQTQQIQQQEDTDPVTAYKQDLARKMGWCPLEEWRGNETDWRDADSFLEATTAVQQAMRKSNEELRGKVDRMGGQLDSVNQKLDQFQKSEQERIQREQQEILKSLQEDRREAIRNADPDEVDRIDQEIRNLEQSGITIPQDNSQQNSQTQMPSSQQQQQDMNPVAKQWMENNPWYNTNDELARAADALIENNIKSGMTMEQALSGITYDLVKQRHTAAQNALYGTPIPSSQNNQPNPGGPRTKVNDVGSGRPPGSGPTRKATINDLTPGQKTMLAELKATSRPDEFNEQMYINNCVQQNNERKQ